MTAGAERIERGESALKEGRLGDAVRELEAAVEGGGIAEEDQGRALFALGTAYGRSGRFFEAAVVGRRLVGVERARGEAGDLNRALALLAVALMNAKAVERVRPVLDELERRLAEVPAARAPGLHRVLHQARFGLALVARDPAEAERRFERIREMVRAGILPPEEEWFLKNAEFHLALAKRDCDAMERILEEVLRGAGAANVYEPEITLRVGLALAHEEAGRIDEARVHALEAARYLATTRSGSEVIVDDGASLVRLLHDRLGEPGAALATAGVVSSAILARIGNLRESAGALEGAMGSGKEALVGEVLGDFEETLLRFLAEVRRMLPMEPWALELPADEFVPVCAWCGSVRLAAERWVALDGIVGPLPPGRITHGICPVCLDEAMEGDEP
jgi:tetratricopeptide (TPR) repeat protein